MAQQFCITQTHLSCYNKLLTLARYVLGQHFSIFMTSNKYSSHYLRPHEASLGCVHTNAEDLASFCLDYSHYVFCKD